MPFRFSDYRPPDFHTLLSSQKQRTGPGKRCRPMTRKGAVHEKEHRSYKGYTGTRYKSAIAATRRTLNWRAVFSASSSRDGERLFIGIHDAEARLQTIRSNHVDPFLQGEPGSVADRVTGFSHKWESCRTMPLVGEFSRGSPVSPSFRRRSIFISITFFGSQYLAVKCRPNLWRNILAVERRQGFRKVGRSRSGEKVTKVTLSGISVNLMYCGQLRVVNSVKLLSLLSADRQAALTRAATLALRGLCKNRLLHGA
ncbi:hypothetical protein PR048_003385 [Dryococelus australis]|uniref:Uncharacterized protein n=1 Tax=Dryococelus australis TaxID=614101 RepID=A0ABQ9IMT6_9NEOP|nr:hypothetical protein PR048_003385 [Dryococelus australis]